jgi:integrase
MAKDTDNDKGPVNFTDRYLKSLKAKPGKKDHLKFDAECRGLGVRVTASGAKRFIVQWTDAATKEKVREPIGVWGAITIEQARAAVRARLGDVARGIDPKAERERRRSEAQRERAEAALTFEALIQQWSTLHLARRSQSYRTEAVRALKHTFTDLLKRPAARITKDDAVNALDKLVAAGKPSMARCTLSYARAAFRWAEKRGKVPSNPFQGLPAIEGGTRERDRVLTESELAEVWAGAGALRYPWGPFYRLAMLTLQRRDEVAAMRWSEIAPDLSIWDLTVKAGKPHIVHLPEAARAILRKVPRIDGCDFVFTTNGAMSIAPGHKQKAMLIAAIEKTRQEAPPKTNGAPEPEPWWVHDFRRSGVTMMARLGIDSIIADKILSHKPKKLHGVAAVYQRYDFACERKKALEIWAAHVTGIGRDGAEVVDLAERRVRG